MIERGTIQQINARGRVTLRLADRVVVADLHSGSGGSVGDLIEGDMRPGLRSWRNVGNSILSVVQVVATHVAAGNDQPPDAGSSAGHGAAASADQNTRRRFS